jgi:hypothetical protein
MADRDKGSVRKLRELGSLPCTPLQLFLAEFNSDNIELVLQISKLMLDFGASLETGIRYRKSLIWTPQTAHDSLTSDFNLAPIIQQLKKESKNISTKPVLQRYRDIKFLYVVEHDRKYAKWSLTCDLGHIVNFANAPKDTTNVSALS